jgi:choline kinase
MKVQLSPEHSVERISKNIDPALAVGEYMGIAWIRPEAAPGLTVALDQTWRRDPSLYYEDALELFAQDGGQVNIAPISQLDWVEVDDRHDLARAREIACQY